jgi:hypothetical protein
MGIKLFRNDNWDRIRNGDISRRDIMDLDGDKDRELIGYLIAHAPEPRRRSMMQYAADKYGMDGFPKPRINTDDPEDTFFWEYAVLREQVVREEDREVLEAALHDPNQSVAAFAFCRLTGYSFPPDECDAYSYRIFSCDILPGMTDAYREAIWDCWISIISS